MMFDGNDFDLAVMRNTDAEITRKWSDTDECFFILFFQAYF